MASPRKKYNSYKKTGCDYLGEVPSSWVVSRLANVFNFSKGYGLSKGELEEFGVNDCILYGELYTKYKSIQKITNDFSRTNSDAGYISSGNEILIPASTTTTGVDLACAKVLDESGVRIGGDIIILNPKIKIDRRFFSHAIENAKCEFAKNSKGVTIVHIYQDGIRDIKCAYPPFDEQRGIANFLDIETSKIDELIKKQESLIELLEERRKAAVAEAVTKGLNLNIEMKSSGVEWLGNVPNHWQVIPVKSFFKLVTELAPNGNNEELLSVFTGIGVRPRKDMEDRGNKASTTDGYWVVRKGDLIINKLLAWMGAIGVSNFDGVTSPAYDILRKKVELNSNYFDYLFRSGICLTEFKKYSRGIMEMRLRLYFEELGQLKMPFPPVDEQNEICDYLDAHLAVYDKLVEKSKQSIELLKEHRSSLISAAVTGKIDVRNS